MSDRERWIVYPLLMLALGTSLRSRLFPASEVQAEAVICKSLTVTDDAGRKTAELAPFGAPSRCALHLLNSDGRITLALGTDVTGQFGVVETLNANGKQQVVLGASAEGGFARAYDAEGTTLVGIGHDRRGSGIYAIDAITSRALPWGYRFKRDQSSLGTGE